MSSASFMPFLKGTIGTVALLIVAGYLIWGIYQFLKQRYGGFGV